nr:hypothetical protein [Tanacetum cinerariifolium]
KLHEKATTQMEKFFQIFQDLHFDISFADALLLMPKFASTIKSLLENKDKLFKLAKISSNENCSTILLKKLPENLGDPDKFLIPCDFLRIDQGEVTKTKSLIKEPLELELKDLLSHLVYAFLEGADKLPMIIAKDLKDDEKEALLKVLKSHKRAIAWKITDIKEFDIIIRDKKGTKNLTADHLSRLENPHKDVFENKDINENFLLDTFGKISSGSTPWFADIANFHAGNFIVKGMSPNKRRNSLRTLDITFRTIPTFFGFVQIKSFNDLSMAKKLMISSELVMKDPPRAIMVELLNHGLKRILERTVRENRASWSEKLKDALWAFRTAYNTPIGCTPYNFNFRDQPYENSLIYKEETEKLHDSKIKNRIFNVGDRVLLFNSCLKIFSRKLKTRWSGPFTITQVFPYGTIELSQPDGLNFKLYCGAKENGIYIFQSIDHGPFELGTTRDTLGTTREGGVLLGPERPRSYDDLNDNEKKRFDVDVCATNIVFQGLPKDIYKLINHNIKA